MQDPISSHAKLLTFGKACGEAWRWHIDTSWILKPICSKAATVEFVEVLELLGLHNMERNGCGDGMETELQNMERNGRETENRGMEGGENIECKGMETEEYWVYLSPPLTWSRTLLVILPFLDFLILCLLLDLMFVLPFGVINFVFAALTGRNCAFIPFCLTWSCFIYPLLKGEWYGSFHHIFIKPRHPLIPFILILGILFLNSLILIFILDLLADLRVLSTAAPSPGGGS